MNLFVDLERQASSSLVESNESPNVVDVPTIFFNDTFELSVRFLQSTTWQGDSATTIKLRIGAFPSLYLIPPTEGTWDGEKYVFSVDFTNQDFDSAILDKLEIRGFFEIQLQENNHSQTIVQQNAVFRNSFLDSPSVVLTTPLAPQIVETEVFSEPLNPSELIVSRNPFKPSDVGLLIKPTKPKILGVGNLSVLPEEPSFEGLEIIVLRPDDPSLIESTIFGLPFAPTIELVGVVLPRPFAPSEVVPTLVVQPLVGEVQAFEVIAHRRHKHHHRFLYLNHDGKFEQRFNGSLLVSSDVPFVFSHIDAFGFPTYYRESNVTLRDFFNKTDIDQEVLRLVLYESPTFQIWSKNKPLAVYPFNRALSYGTGGANRVNLSSIGLPDHWTPKHIPFDLGDGVDASLYALEGVLGYDYGVDTSTAQMPDTIAFRYFANNIKKPENQIGRLGTKDYGGKLISYFQTENHLGNVWNKGAINFGHYEDNSLGLETPSSDFRITLNPALNPLRATTPSLASNVEAVQIVDVNQLPSNVEADLIDFQPLRYSPTLWVDASQEDDSKTDFGRLTNFAQSSSEVLFHQGQETLFSSITQSDKKLFDFSSTAQSYKVPLNAFGRHQTDTGGEFELFFAFKPLSFNSATETFVNDDVLPPSTRKYSPHAFVNQGGQHAFTAHLPWDQDQLIFDAGRSTPARVSGGLGSLPVDEFHIVTLVASATRGKVQAFVNGTFIMENNYHEPITMTKLLLGGWGTKPYGQSMLVGELICFKNVLGFDRQQKVEGYLAHKWGVSQKLNSAHPFRFKNPINFGEFIELERFPRPPINPLFEVYPNPPTTPLVGFPPDANPSEVETLSFVNPPSQIETRDIPPLRFFEDEVEVSAINLNGIVTEAPQFEQTINERVSALIAKDTSNNQQAVSWTIQSITSNDIAPTITGASSPQPSAFSLNLEDHKPFLANNEVASLNFEVKIEDSNGEQNILPVNMILKGIEQSKFISEITDVSMGGEITSQGESVNLTTEIDFSGNYRWYIPHNTQKTHTFKITLSSPSKIEPKLFLRYWGQQYDGSLQYQARNAGRAVWFYTETEVTLNTPITPIVQSHSQIIGNKNGSYGWFTGWNDPWFRHNAPLVVTCTSINEIIPNVSREYTIEMQLLEPENGLDNALNKFHWLGYKKRWLSLNRFGVDVDVMKADRNKLTGFSFTANTPKIIQKEAEGIAWFNNKYSNKYNSNYSRVNVTPQIVPDSYSIRQPSWVKTQIGAGVWAYPSEVKVEPQKPQFPVDSNFALAFQRTFFYKGERGYNNATNSWDLKSGTFHFIDPRNQVLGWQNSMFQQKHLSITEGQGQTWQWGLNLKRFEDGSRMSPTFIHHSKLSNITITSVGYRQQNPWNYYQKPYLVDGFLDEKTQHALEPQEEFLVRFPSGRTQITQFGGYVQTSGNVVIEFFNSDNKQTPVWKYTIHPSNLNHKPMTMRVFENDTQWGWEDNSRKIEKDMPTIVLPIIANMRRQGINNFGGTAMYDNRVAVSLNPLQNKFLNGDLGEDSRWSDSRFGDLRSKFNQSFTEKEFFDFFVPNQKPYYTHVNDWGGEHIKYERTEYGLHPVGENKFFNVTNSPICKVTFEAFDRVDKSVHPSWGAKLVQWTHNEVPNLPRQFDVTSQSEGTATWSFARWQEYREQTPTPPHMQSIKAVLTFDDLVPSNTTLNEFVYDVATINNPTYVVFNVTNSEVETGQVWRVENMVQGGSNDAEKERNFKINLKRQDLDGEYSLQLSLEDAPSFSSQFYNINPIGYVANEKTPRFAVLKNNPDAVKEVIAGGFLRWWYADTTNGGGVEPSSWTELKANWVQAREDTPLFIEGGTGYVRTKIYGDILTRTWSGQASQVDSLPAGSYFKILRMHSAWYSNISVKSYPWTWNDYYYDPPWNGTIITNKRDTKAYWVVLQKLEDHKARNNKIYYARVESKDFDKSIVTGVVFNEITQPPTAPTFVETKAMLKSDDLSVVQTTLSTTREIISVNQLMDDPNDFSTIESDHFIEMGADSPRFANAILRPIAVIDCLINSGLDQYLRDANGNIRYQVNQADGTYVPMENPDYIPYYTIKGLSCVMNGTFDQPQVNVIIKPDTINGGLTFGQSTSGTNLATYESNLRVLSVPNFEPTFKSKYYRHWKNRIYQNFIQPYNTATQLVGKYLVLARDYGTGLKHGDVIKVDSVNYVQPTTGVIGHKDIFYIKQGEPHPLTIPKIDMLTNEAWGIFADWGFELVEE